MEDTDHSTTEYRLHRASGAEPSRFARIRSRWWFKLIAWAALAAGIGAFLLWFLFARGLPSVDQLKTYEPPLPTNVRSINGEPIHTFARERRVELSYDEYPPLLVRAYMSAEDKTFFQHHGVDFPGLIRAAAEGIIKGRTPRGTSTITQQVAKNLLLTNEVSYVRKIKEAILAWRIENALTKQQIMELYLNQIFLGRNAYGVEAASHAYFDKDLDQLKLSQMAYLAILPKGPANYDPERDTERALDRRNWVLGEMLKNDFITRPQYQEAVAEPLGTVSRIEQSEDDQQQVGGYFIEAVRRQLVDKFGDNSQDGPHSVYAGGLWVRSSLDPTLQKYAQEALRDGLVRYDRGRGWSGPMRQVEINDGDWQRALVGTHVGLDYRDWRPAIVISIDGGDAQIGFGDGSTGTLPRSGATMPVRGKGGAAFDALKAGDVIAVSPSGSGFSLESIPRVSGGLMVENPTSGRIMAMQGGFDSRIQSFNRAIQAQRQPGSTIKPIVYSAALEQGMTPATMIQDTTFCVYQGANLGQKCFKNFAHEGGSGAHTLRWGIEQSRNLMTVRAAAQTGMEHVVDMIQRLGVSREKYPPYLSYSLGAGETTVMRMVNAYSTLVNHGQKLTPTLIDYVQDRRGQVIWPDNWRACDGCNAPDWNGKAMPRPVSHSKQVVDPLTAYQMVHIMEGVIQRGTGVRLRSLDRPMVGKTGTTNGPTDVWFMGGTPQMIGGVYVGYDNPRNLGGYAQGSSIAVPIMKQFFEQALKDLPKVPFRAPSGIRMVKIDRRSGRPVFGVWPTDEPLAPVIWEAFKPENAPRRAARRDDDQRAAPKKAAPTRRESQGDSDFLQREGGIY
ncbi:penicillin-binding protein 1A [Stakelama pacifica]|uniref:Penicillin-binding protein 1A n=1 Tax=Stakelama pacifica TaxID=517720 RepID=A0A4R6FHA7_9SPHN|nr:PBP1A family penicillin-binding protein [Stakelama pacifica]TDN80771.1 penicillin-binding protein 1A [Stakelama pacifica]GGO97198.1 penicillin-binding protein 1A [Stakelama pacifica]